MVEESTELIDEPAKRAKEELKQMIQPRELGGRCQKGQVSKLGKPKRMSRRNKSPDGAVRAERPKRPKLELEGEC